MKKPRTINTRCFYEVRESCMNLASSVEHDYIFEEHDGSLVGVLTSEIETEIDLVVTEVLINSEHKILEFISKQKCHE